MSTTDKVTTYLTETILTIHNEVQSALDRISTTSVAKGTELGKSTAILSVQNLRVKIPLKFSLEISQGTTANSSTPTTTQLTGLIRNGLIINKQNGLQSLSKIKIDLLPEGTQTASTGTSTTETPKEVWGEIEITFSPIARQ